MLLTILSFLALLLGDTSAQTVVPLEGEIHVSEGDNVTLSCNYSNQLLRLLTGSGNKDAEYRIILQRNVSECEACQRHSKTKPKPAVSLSLPSQYNETVPVDLHGLGPGVSPHY
ncbi:hypothetical protein AOLI_G00113640 [Acnodon oligacanthus]